MPGCGGIQVFEYFYVQRKDGDMWKRLTKARFYRGTPALFTPTHAIMRVELSLASYRCGGAA